MTGALCVGTIFSKLYHSEENTYIERLKLSSAAIVEQSLSLRSECAFVLGKIEKMYYGRLKVVALQNSPINSRKKRTLNQEDIDELCRNLCNDALIVEDLTDLFIDHQQFPTSSSSSPSTPNIIEKYRLLPLSDVEKFIAATPTDSNTETTTSTLLSTTSTSTSNSKRKIEKIERKKSPVVDILDIVLDIERLAIDVSSNYMLQQERLQKALNIKAAQVLTPQESLWEASKISIASLGSYMAFCAAINRFWPVVTTHPLAQTLWLNQSFLGLKLSSSLPTLKRPNLLSAFFIFPSICIFHYAATSAFGSDSDKNKMSGSAFMQSNRENAASRKGPGQHLHDFQQDGEGEENEQSDLFDKMFKFFQMDEEEMEELEARAQVC